MEKENTNNVKPVVAVATNPPQDDVVTPELAPLPVAIYGTKAKRDEAYAAAIKAGKTQEEATQAANATFTAYVPDLACDEETILASFVQCYGFTDRPDRGTATDQFWLKCQKHLLDTLRAEYHRGPSKKISPEARELDRKLALLSPEKRAEFMSLLAKL